MDDKGHCYYAVMSNETGKCSYEEIYRWVCRVPEGKVVSYGQIARLVAGRCSARQVGYAMAAAPEDSGIPWHRVINSQGRISLRAGSDGHRQQRILLIVSRIFRTFFEGAVPVPPDRFPKLLGPWQTLTDFMRFCNVVEAPYIRRDLST